MSGLKYIYKDTDRHGNERVYFRKPPLKKVRLRAIVGSAEFHKEYGELLSKLSNDAENDGDNNASKHSTRGFVYFIRSANAVKIGVTRNLSTRMSELQVSNAHRLELIAAIPGGRALEKRLHEKFARHRANGEWFRLSPEITEWLSADLAERLKHRP